VAQIDDEYMPVRERVGARRSSDWMPVREKWIQGSIKHKGRVHRYIMREYGDEAFDCHGRRCVIKPEYLDRAIKKARRMGETSLLKALDEAKTLKRIGRSRMAYA
jgi:hypothetical protein